ncbi:MAG: DUF6524 family protein [Pseudomonadota bacterium]|nr:DUF6524 family protein [Pseudomonadota bacterium]
MRFDFGDFMQRWIIALILVFATFNPTGWSFLTWVLENPFTQLPYKALAGVLLLIGYVIFLRATWRSIGAFGILLVVALFGAVFWVLADLGLMDASDSTLVTWLVLVVAATVLGVGVSWSHVRRRVSGQADVDDIEN